MEEGKQGRTKQGITEGTSEKGTSQILRGGCLLQEKDQRPLPGFRKLTMAVQIAGGGLLAPEAPASSMGKEAAQLISYLLLGVVGGIKHRLTNKPLPSSTAFKKHKNIINFAWPLLQNLRLHKLKIIQNVTTCFQKPCSD